MEGKSCKVSIQLTEDSSLSDSSVTVLILRNGSLLLQEVENMFESMKQGKEKSEWIYAGLSWSISLPISIEASKEVTERNSSYTKNLLS
jgi:hypothetical protein